MATFDLRAILGQCTSSGPLSEVEDVHVRGRVKQQTMNVWSPEVPDEEEDMEPLLEGHDSRQNLPWSGGCIQALRTNAVDSERCAGPGAQGHTGRGQRRELEALATPPVELNAKLPEDHSPGSKILISGPHGRVEVQTPEDVPPGETITYVLAPTPEYRMQVPPGAMAGSSMRFVRADGLEVITAVPFGVPPGQWFEVSPPALMVQVPAGARPGDSVVFRHSLGSSNKGAACEETEWCRSRVPDGLRPGGYFAARLPRPEPPSLTRQGLLELVVAAL